ncbi:MAG TPA: hypothetical protein VEP28_15460, partial [Rubrobacter sp.]|nr:hypothetical protein [Rubrobacter sp.]
MMDGTSDLAGPAVTSLSTPSRLLRLSALSGSLLLLAFQVAHAPAFSLERKAARGALQESRHWRAVAAKTAV